MDNKAYIVMGYGGSYDDHFSFPNKVYLDKEKAKLWVAKADMIFTKLFSFYLTKYSELPTPITEDNVVKWEIYMKRMEKYECFFGIIDIEITN